MLDLATPGVLGAASGDGDDGGGERGGGGGQRGGRLTTVDGFTAPDAAVCSLRPALNRRCLHFLLTPFLLALIPLLLPLLLPLIRYRFYYTRTTTIITNSNEPYQALRIAHKQ